MRRRVLVPLFVLILGAWAGREAAAERVGKVAQATPERVQAERPGEPVETVALPYPVERKMKIRTLKKAGAKVAIELGRQGSITLGSETEVELKDEVVGLPGGKLGFWVGLGYFRAVFAPAARGKGPGAGEYWIEIPGRTRPIVLYGTDVHVKVERDGTASVYVAEGEVVIENEEGEGEPVRVRGGFWTEIRPGSPPTPPQPIDPRGDRLSPEANPKEEPHADPPIDPDDPRLDLPKSGGPP